MEPTVFEQWLTRADELTEAQRHHARTTLGEQSEGAAARAAVERNLPEDRPCPHCHTPGASIHSYSKKGMRRYRCHTCRRTFSATTGTALHGRHDKDRWLRFCQSLARGESVRRAAQRCEICIETAFRWRHRFLRAADTEPEKLRGTVEVDETYLLQSRKGQRVTGRRPRRRGGRAQRRGRSAKPVSILVAADRGEATCSKVLPPPTAAAIASRRADWVDPDALLVSDGDRTYSACARHLGLRHEAVNLSAGMRVRGPVHIQTVNSRHSQWKGFLRPLRGVSTHDLGNYLRLLHLTALPHCPPPGTCTAAIISNVAT